MRQGLVFLAPFLILAGCDTPPNWNNPDGSLDRNGYRVQATGDCADRIAREQPTLGEADKIALCTCIAATVEREHTDDQLRDYLNRFFRRGAMPPEVSQRAQQQCAREVEPPPAEEPPPSMSGGVPPPIVSGGLPGYDRAPDDGPAPGGGELADGPDAGAGASAPGGSRARVAAGSLARYVSADDYPAASLRNNEQGRVVFTLDVNSEGRVTNCAIAESSGSGALDSTTCRIMRSRARYTPARDARGRPVADRDRGIVRWQLPN